MTRVTWVLIVTAIIASASGAFAANCPGPTRTSTGPGGKALTLCLEGKYSTCVRDSIRLGYTAERAKTYCDGRKAAGAVH
jgi:hypothetical protein